jgi:thiol-disulfide isomerase/thioredoxin
MRGFLERVGGVLVAPPPTMRALARGGLGGGRHALRDVGILIGLRVVAGELPSLVSAGARAVKGSLAAGLQALLVTVGQIAPDVLGILVAGLLLSALAGHRRRPEPDPAHDAATAFDLAAYAWVPYLAGRLVFVLGAIASGRVPSAAAQRVGDVVALLWALVAWVSALIALRDERRAEPDAPAPAAPAAAVAAGALLVAMLLALGGLRGVAVARGWEELVTVGVPPGGAAPPVELSMADGRRAHIPDPDDGRVVALAFWATWCAPCREELPRLERIAARLDRSRLRIIAVNIEEPEAKPEATRLARSLAPSLELAFDGSAAAARYRVVTIPFTAVVGPDGKARALLDGLHAERDIEAALRSALDKK